MTNQIEPDKRAELLAGKIKLYEKLVTKSKALSVGATKGEPGIKKGRSLSIILQQKVEVEQ